MKRPLAVVLVFALGLEPIRAAAQVKVVLPEGSALGSPGSGVSIAIPGAPAGAPAPPVLLLPAALPEAVSATPVPAAGAVTISGVPGALAGAAQGGLAAAKPASKMLARAAKALAATGEARVARAGAGVIGKETMERKAVNDRLFDNQAAAKGEPRSVAGSSGARRNALEPSAPPAKGRLPAGIRPESYDIKLRVDPEAETFGGEVRIQVQIERETTQVVLHALDLRVSRASVAGRPISADRIRVDAAAETLTLTLDEPLGPGAAEVELAFSGTLNKQMRGLYLSTAKREGMVEKYAFTHFEPTSARRMVPSFDEPALKAKFRLSVTAPEHLKVLSNQPAGDRRVEAGWQTVSFGESPVMSSYLLALAVGRLASKTRVVDGTPVTVWARPEDLSQADLALDVAEASLKRLNRYFGVRYQLPKLDLVALPDFAAGAMENWGVIFFRDSALLADPKLSSARAKRRVAEVVAHEIVHQWFGNLVTMQWWDDLWLNEAFATWLAFKVVDGWKPAWRSWLDFEARKRRALLVDALRRTRPIVAPASSSGEIEAQFDALSYEKGGGLLRMIEAYLGETKFRAGIRAYMRRHQYGNTKASDLWKALERASGVPVAKLAEDWLKRPGYPVVSARVASPGARALELSQRRFDAHGDGQAGVWTVPVVLRYRLQGESRTRTHRVLLTEASKTVRLPGKGALLWAYPNADETGLYRVALDAPLLDAVRRDWKRLAVVERAGLLNHLWARMRSGETAASEFLGTLAAMRTETNRLVLDDLSTYLRRLEGIVEEKDRAGFTRFVNEVFGPHWDRLGWSGRPAENDDAKLGRGAALAALALAPAPALGSEAAKRLERYFKDPKSLEPALAGPLLELGARSGGAERWEEYRRRMNAATTPEQRDLLMAALADFRQKELVRRTMDLALGSEVRGQDLWKPLTRLLDNPEAQGEAWRLIKERWSEIREKGGPKGATRVIEGLGSLTRNEWLMDVRGFFADPKNQVPSASRALDQALEAIELGIQLRERQAGPLGAWLRQRDS